MSDKEKLEETLATLQESLAKAQLAFDQNNAKLAEQQSNQQHKHAELQQILDSLKTVQDLQRDFISGLPGSSKE